jgi:hypothetical protein
MATVTELRTAAAQAGFTGAALTVAVAIALAESGGNENASHKNPNGTTDMGAWQINSSHTTLLAGHNPYNLQQNANMAYALYKGRGGNFQDWTTAHTIDGKPPAYLAHIGQATGQGTQYNVAHQSEVLGSPVLGSLDSAGSDALSGAASALNPISGIDSFFSAIGGITTAAFWKRVGIGFLAFLLLLIGLILMIESNKTVRTATADGAKAAALA